MKQEDIKKIIKEEVKKGLMENTAIRKAVLENRLVVVKEMISLNEVDFINKAKTWLKNKAFGAEQGAKDTFKNNVMVNPDKIVSNPSSVTKILDTAIKTTQSQITKFRSDTLQTSTAINNLQDQVFDLFGKFYNLLDSIPEEKRGLYEREVMKVVSVFYNLLEEEKKRIEVYISALANKAGQEGYNLGAGAADMASFSNKKAPLPGPSLNPPSRMPNRSRVGGSAMIKPGIRPAGR